MFVSTVTILTAGIQLVERLVVYMAGGEKRAGNDNTYSWEHPRHPGEGRRGKGKGGVFLFTLNGLYISTERSLPHRQVLSPLYSHTAVSHNCTVISTKLSLHQQTP